MQTEQPHFLVFPFVSGQFSASAIEDETVCAIPALHHVEAFVNFTPQPLRGYIAAEEDGLDGFAKFSEGLVNRVLNVVPCEPAKETLGIHHSQLQCHHMFHHGIELFLYRAPS